jgi:hypothetical protein
MQIIDGMRWLGAAALSIAAFTASLPARADAAGDADAWQFDVRLYGWAADIDGKLNYRLPNGRDRVTIDAGDVVDGLQGAFMGSAMARRGDWSVLTDLIYLSFSDSANNAVQLPPAFGPGANINADMEVTGWIWSLVGGYRAYHSERADLNLLLGFRMSSFDTDTKLRVTGPLPPTLPPAKLSKSLTLWDGIIGARGRVLLSDRWFMPYYADIGVGDSNWTWQAMAGVGYGFDWGHLSLTYRHLYYDQSDDDLLDDMSFSGPEFGVGFSF